MTTINRFTPFSGQSLDQLEKWADLLEKSSNGRKYIWVRQDQSCFLNGKEAEYSDSVELLTLEKIINISNRILNAAAIEIRPVQEEEDEKYHVESASESDDGSDDEENDFDAKEARFNNAFSKINKVLNEFYTSRKVKPNYDNNLEAFFKELNSIEKPFLVNISRLNEFSLKKILQEIANLRAFAQEFETNDGELEDGEFKKRLITLSKKIQNIETPIDAPEDRVELFDAIQNIEEIVKAGNGTECQSIKAFIDATNEVNLPKAQLPFTNKNLTLKKPIIILSSHPTVFEPKISPKLEQLDKFKKVIQEASDRKNKGYIYKNTEGQWEYLFTKVPQGMEKQNLFSIVQEARTKIEEVSTDIERFSQEASKFESDELKEQAKKIITEKTNIIREIRTDIAQELRKLQKFQATKYDSSSLTLKCAAIKVLQFFLSLVCIKMQSETLKKVEQYNKDKDALNKALADIASINLNNNKNI